MNQRLASAVERMLLLGLLLLACVLWRWQPAAPDLLASTPRLAAAAAALLAWFGGTALLLGRSRPQPVGNGAGADAIPVVFATQTGTAEAIARRTADSLASAGVPAQALPIAQAWPLFGTASRLLFVASTTGEGDPPDEAFAFSQAMDRERPDLSHLRVGVLALGDSSYSDFCGFGCQLDSWLQARGARALFPRIDVDDGDPAALAAWFAALQQHCEAIGNLARDAPGFPRWRLRQRHCLNPGSLGEPAWHIELVPEDPALLAWQAGDLAEVHPGIEPPREYSIASLPADGAMHLLVREHRRGDDTPGIASHLLCRGAQPGDGIALRIRRNRAFHPPADDRPLLLVGNGTGMAGLRALLKAREAAGHPRNWLLFGERQPGVDGFYSADIQRWQATGSLQRVDLAWSRGPTRAYVQDRLLEAAVELRRWIDEGAALYVCGSLKGMAKGVDTALRQLLGAEQMALLAATGRYRRDVY